jgi:hypothetical protein
MRFLVPSVFTLRPTGGVLACTGLNDEGQLFANSKGTACIPQPQLMDTLSTQRIIAVATGTSHTAVMHPLFGGIVAVFCVVACCRSCVAPHCPAGAALYWFRSHVWQQRVSRPLLSCQTVVLLNQLFS